MMIRTLAQGVNDPPQLADIPRPVIDVTHIESMTFAVIERGMASGEPSVVIVVSDEQGSVLMQTSLDKLLAAAYGLKGLAQSRSGWVQPEGSFTLMPPSREARKAMLLAIEAELRGWDDAEEAAS